MIIFKHRIYKSEDLEALFGRLLIHNPSLHMVWIEDIFNEIREEFLDLEWNSLSINRLNYTNL